MKASEVKVGDWVEVGTSAGLVYAKVKSRRGGAVMIRSSRVNLRIEADEDSAICRKLDADEVAALMLE